MKKFIKNIIIFSIPLVIIISINFWIDNAYIFKGEKTYMRIGKLIAKGKNISNLYNFDEFLTKKNVIDFMDKSPEIISFGSSRVLQLNGKCFKNKSFFNMGVSASSLKEIMATYYVVKNKGFYPETVIISIDPSIFLKKLARVREGFIMDYKKLSEEWKLNNSMDIRYGVNKYTEVLNPVYAYENIKFGKKSYSLTDSIFINEPVICADGSYVYKRELRIQPASSGIVKAKNQYNTFFYQRFNKMNIDKDLQKLFEDFIYKIQKEHKVIFFLAPFHPYFSNNFDKDELNMILEVEDYFVNYSKHRNIQLIGGFDSRKYNFSIDNDDFYDGVHPKRELVEDIFRSSDLEIN